MDRRDFLKGIGGLAAAVVIKDELAPKKAEAESEVKKPVCTLVNIEVEVDAGAYKSSFFAVFDEGILVEAQDIENEWDEITPRRLKLLKKGYVEEGYICTFPGEYDELEHLLFDNSFIGSVTDNNELTLEQLKSRVENWEPFPAENFNLGG